MTVTMPALQPHVREKCLLEVESLLGSDRPLQDRLEAVATELGTRMGVQRVVVYGHGDSRDSAVRVRVQWTAPERRPLGDWIGAIPLISDRPEDRAIVTSTPQGTYCPDDCPSSLATCDLQHACSSIIQPLRLGSVRYGTLAVHAVTGTAWNDQQASLVENVARRITLEIAVARQRRVEAHLDAQRSGIAATALHQIATPVTIIEGVIDQLGQAGEAPPELLRIASVEVEHLRRLCDDIAVIAGGSLPGLTGTRDRCDVAATVQAAVRSAELRHAGTTIRLEVEDQLPCANCDAVDLARTLDRVVDNAVRYAGRSSKVDVACWADDGRVFVRVRDDGDGVTAAQAAVLGEPFARLDPNMRSQPGGFGLSLAVGMQAMRRHGGDLHIEPRSDSPGTQVTIVLPASTPAW